MGSTDITLTSTTNSLEEVQSALGIPVAQQATEAPAGPAPSQAPVPAQPGVVSATAAAPKATTRGRAATSLAPPAPAASPAAPAPAAVEPPVAAPPAEPVPAAPVPVDPPPADDVDGDGDDELDTETDPAASEAAVRLGRKGGQVRGKLQARLHKVLQTNSQIRGEKAAADAELVALRRRVAELSAGGVPPGQPPGAPGTSLPAAPPAEPKPTLDQFSSYEDYTEAVAEWKANIISKKAVSEALAHERAQQQQTAQQQQQQTAAQAYNAKVIEAQTKYDDFDEVVGQPDLNTTPLMDGVLIASEHGPEMAYYLGQHPELCKKIFALGNSPLAAKELGKVEAAVEARLGAEKKTGGTLGAVAAATPAPAPAPAPAAPAALAPPRAVTKAPDPISPVGTGAVATSKSPDQMSFNEYKQWRAAGGGR